MKNPNNLKSYCLSSILHYCLKKQLNLEIAVRQIKCVHFFNEETLETERNFIPSLFIGYIKKEISKLIFSDISVQKMLSSLIGVFIFYSKRVQNFFYKDILLQKFCLLSHIPFENWKNKVIRRSLDLDPIITLNFLSIRYKTIKFRWFKQAISLGTNILIKLEHTTVFKMYINHKKIQDKLVEMFIYDISLIKYINNPTFEMIKTCLKWNPDLVSTKI